MIIIIIIIIIFIIIISVIIIIIIKATGSDATIILQNPTDSGLRSANSSNAVSLSDYEYTHLYMALNGDEFQVGHIGQEPFISVKVCKILVNDRVL